jgi:hypothetical protein
MDPAARLLNLHQVALFLPPQRSRRFKAEIDMCRAFPSQVAPTNEGSACYFS